MKDSAWKRLVEKIQEGTVVPVVGSRLLVGPDGQSSLQAQVAARVLEEFESCRSENGKAPLPAFEDPLPPFRELNELVEMGTAELALRPRAGGRSRCAIAGEAKGPSA